MKKIISALFLGLLCMGGEAEAVQNKNQGKLSIGYEGVFAGNTLQGISSRYWFCNNIGGELNVFYGRAGVTAKENGNEILDAKGDLLYGSAKFIYAPVVKDHSRFYCGLEGGIGRIDGEMNSDDIPGDISVYTISPLVGAEFNLAEIPDLGFNWEAGYKFHKVSANDVISDDSDVDLNMGGTFVTIGAHYYF